MKIALPILPSLLTTMALLSLSFGSYAQPTERDSAKAKFGIAIHGGAGTILREKLTPLKKQMIEKTLSQALNAGYIVLESGGSSEQAVISAIKILENSSLFNAGKGAAYTYDGAHELDASIMTGQDLNAGAVAGVKHIKNPIELAQLVKDKSVHVMLSGEGAEQFATTHDIKLVENSYFNTERRFKALQRVKKKLEQDDNKSSDFQARHLQLDSQYKMGTVGAVALDQHGNLAAGTSTGGMTAKRYGRIGDSPIIGAGTYANNNSCAVSATGHGEYFIRYQVAADICRRMEYLNVPLAQAANHVVFDVLHANGGSGGIIAIDNQGNITMPFNTKGMYRAQRSVGKKEHIAIFAEPDNASK